MEGEVCPDHIHLLVVILEERKWHTGQRHIRFGRNPRKAAQGILSALRTGGVGDVLAVKLIAEIAGLNKFLRIYYARVIAVYYQ